MRKTAQDGESASEPAEVTTEAHSQSAKDSQSSLDERDAENESQLATGAPTTDARAGAPTANAAEPDIDIEIEDPDPPLEAAAEGDAVPPAPPDVIDAANSTAVEPIVSAKEPRADAVATEAAAPEPEAELPATSALDSNDDLDFEQAERYAASFRPSWEPDFPVTPMIPPAQIVGTTGGKARVVRHNTRGDLTAPKLRKHRGASYAILAGSLMGMAALFYTAVHSSSVSPDDSIASESVETQVHAARTQEPPSPPQPESVQPSAASEPEAPAEITAAPTLEQPAEVPADPLAELAAAAPTLEPTPGEPTAAPVAPELAPTPVLEPAPPAIAADPIAAVTPAQPPAQPTPELTPQPSAAGLSAAAPAAAPDSKGAERPTKVLLSLAAHPPSTRLRLDGVPIDNPFRARLPRSSTHRIEARAPGFTPEVHSLRLEADVQLMISLKREPARDVKPDPYRDQRRSAVVQPAPTRSRGAGFVAENPY